MLDGTNPVGWITRAEVYFEVQNTSNVVKLKLADPICKGLLH